MSSSPLPWVPSLESNDASETRAVAMGLAGPDARAGSKLALGLTWMRTSESARSFDASAPTTAVRVADLAPSSNLALKPRVAL